MRHELTVEIERPPKDVFPFLCEPDRMVRWMSGIESCKRRQEGAPAAGHEFDLIMHGPKGDSEPAVLRLTELDRNERLGFVIESSAPAIEGHYILDASPSGTTLILTRDTVERTFGERWRARRVARQLESVLRDDLARLKSLVETA